MTIPKRRNVKENNSENDSSGKRTILKREKLNKGNSEQETSEQGQL